MDELLAEEEELVFSEAESDDGLEEEQEQGQEQEEEEKEVTDCLHVRRSLCISHLLQLDQRIMELPLIWAL
eukprot:COSAG01_NODE_20561_length_947_cov_99.126179_2_plen_71_part_00